MDDIEIINKKSANFHKIFTIPFDQFLLDAIDGKDFCDFKKLSINEITERMEERFNKSILDKEKQIRRQINRLQQIIKDKFPSTVALIISKPWEGISDKNFGYFINPQIACFAAKDKNL